VTKFLDLTLNGISNGAVYAAVALALVLIWRATRIVNFAQGAMLMITTFIASAVINSSGSYWLGFGVALVSGLVLGAVVERVVIRPVEGAPPLNAVILTLGLYTLLVAVAGMIWGNQPRSFPAAFSLQGYQVGNTRLLFTSNDSFSLHGRVAERHPGRTAGARPVAVQSQMPRTSRGERGDRPWLGRGAPRSAAWTSRSRAWSPRMPVAASL
jgi:hypothetical protein